MFELIDKTVVNKRLRFTELYKIMHADKAVKADGKSISSVVLTNVISPDTMNICAGEKVKEIYFFEFTLSSKTIPALFISALDKETCLHTVFVLRYENQSMLYGCFKEINGKKVKLGKYYCTEWLDVTDKKALPLNIATTDDVYKAIIEELVPLNISEGEGTADFVNRFEKISKLKKTIEKIQRQVDSERQSKKRFELNDELKKLKKELYALDNK